jgi:hypothetical protein
VILPEPIDGMQSTGRGFWRPGALKLPAEAQFGRRCGTPLPPLSQLSPSDRTGALPQIPPSDLDIPVLGPKVGECSLTQKAGIERPRSIVQGIGQ